MSECALKSDEIETFIFFSTQMQIKQFKVIILFYEFAYMGKIVSYLPVLNFLLFSKDSCALLTWIQQEIQAFSCGLTLRVSFTHAKVETEDDLQM